MSNEALVLELGKSAQRVNNAKEHYEECLRANMGIKQALEQLNTLELLHLDIRQSMRAKNG